MTKESSNLNFYTYFLAPSDAASARQLYMFDLLNSLAKDLDFELCMHSHWLLLMFPQPKSILELLSLILVIESSILNFLQIWIDSFWCFISHKVVHIWPTEHISGQSKIKVCHCVLIVLFWCHNNYVLVQF